MAKKWMNGSGLLFAILFLFFLSECSPEEIVNAVVSTYYGYQTQFHLADCSVIKNVLAAALSKFTSRDSAISAGLTPCSVCKP